MKKSKADLQDDLKPEYDFHALRVVARGPGRKNPGEVSVALAPDVARIFPDSESVNEALRFLMRMTEREMSRQS
jgi:hypothetical protein